MRSAATVRWTPLPCGRQRQRLARRRAVGAGAARLAQLRRMRRLVSGAQIDAHGPVNMPWSGATANSARSPSRFHVRREIADLPCPWIRFVECTQTDCTQGVQWFLSSSQRCRSPAHCRPIVGLHTTQRHTHTCTRTQTQIASAPRLGARDGSLTLTLTHSGCKLWHRAWKRGRRSVHRLVDYRLHLVPGCSSRDALPMP